VAGWDCAQIGTASLIASAAANNCCARRAPREGQQRLQRAAAASLSAGARNPESSPTYFPKAWAIWPTSLAQPMSIAP
jgi:hypothetical protein